MTKEASPDLTVFVQQCLHNQTENGQISFQNGEAFANVVLQFTEAGLVGNRAIPSTGLWNVVLAMERAFPVLLSPGVDAVRSQEASGMGSVSKLWIQQAAQDGSLAFLVSKVRSQPQVYTAYLSSAPMRSKEATAEFEAAVLPLKGSVDAPTKLVAVQIYVSENGAKLEANGAIGSLYGFVSHAAESAVRPGQQVGSKEAPTTTSNRGPEASTSSEPPAKPHSSKSPRAPISLSKQEEEEAAAAEELVLRLRTAATAVLQAGVGPAADILGLGDADLQAVCSGVDALLRHGLRPANPRDKWTQYLPGRRTGPLDMLQEAQRLAAVEEDKGWGLEGVEALAGGHSSEAALQMWIRSSLNERALGSRLRALCNTPSLLQAWYSRSAVLRQEEAAGQLLGVLMGLDAVKVLLPVEADTPEQPTNGSVGFLAGVANFLPGRYSHAAANPSIGRLSPPHMTSSPKMRKRTRAVTINEALEEPRPGSAAASAAAADRSPAASELPSSSLGALLLSPMSSADISAEPLSPTITAAFQALRARHLAGLNAQPSPEDRAADSDLLAQLLQQQGFHSGSPAPDLARLGRSTDPGVYPGESGVAADGQDTGAAGPSTESAPELAAFLDDLLATPEDSMFVPQLGGEPLQFSGDPGKDPPPWQPLKPRSRGASVPETPTASREAGAGAGGSPFLAAQEVPSYNSAEERRKAAEAAAAASERVRSRLARRRVTSEGSEVQTPSAAAAERQQEEAGTISTAGSSSTMLGARSQEGDFYRLLDSEEPAPRRSFCLDKDEQLPRSFSIAARGGQPQASGVMDQRAEENEEAVLEEDVTDANLLEDMNEILMLDLGGLGAFRSPLGSPPRTGSAHFSFDDPHHPPRPPDPGPLPPTWRVAEARVVGAATVAEGTSEYTRYSVEVTPADEGEAWTVHHRFKDFMALRSALTALVGPGGLPQCWADVSKARSVTGRHRLAPEVVAARQAMLDRCLVSVVAIGPPLSEAPPLLAFLAPADPHWDPSSQPPGTPQRPTPGHGRDAGSAASHLARAGSEHASSASSSAEAGNRYGSLVRLLTEEPQKLAEADLIRMQRGQCAACRSPLPPPVKQSGFLGGRSAATGPRRCEYNARLYCHECHGGDLAELPALVLHHWDFHPRPVSTMAADYLSSIADRPLLCIGAVNPGLYARVPMLARAQDLRTRACKALAAARASGPEGADKAKRLLAGAGPRRYLLESPDFWAMRELVELSKGAFSRLPAWLEAAAARAASLATSALLTAAAEHQQRPSRR
ncbi:hypothetical protein WJX75_000268 [Coccomyxa subellipsoidea]|uniref:PX domain-containing protein n=1 Tax=Coccomyxa subellipsoidea TaxID=248742 RepID=A0ABR2YZA9_9CHLO